LGEEIFEHKIETNKIFIDIKHKIGEKNESINLILEKYQNNIYKESIDSIKKLDFRLQEIIKSLHSIGLDYNLVLNKPIDLRENSYNVKKVKNPGDHYLIIFQRFNEKMVYILQFINEISQSSYHSLIRDSSDKNLNHHIKTFISIKKKINEVLSLTNYFVEIKTISGSRKYNDFQKYVYANWLMQSKKELYNSFFPKKIKNEIRSLGIDKEAGISVGWISNRDIDKLIEWAGAYRLENKLFKLN
jgi:hypothetical protein